MVAIEDVFELLFLFQMFHHYNGRVPLKNSLMIVPNGETPLGSEEILVKTLYKMFKDTKSHGLVSFQFFSALNIFSGRDVNLSRDTITEPYNNLLLETLNERQNISFERISDLTAEISFKMKHSTLSNLERKNDQDKKRNEIVKEIHEFVKNPGDEK